MQTIYQNISKHTLVFIPINLFILFLNFIGLNNMMNTVSNDATANTTNLEFTHRTCQNTMGKRCSDRLPQPQSHSNHNRAKDAPVVCDYPRRGLAAPSGMLTSQRHPQLHQCKRHSCRLPPPKRHSN